MTKLSSFLVFSFGIFLIVTVAVLSFKKSTPQSPQSSGAPSAALPHNDMPPLELGTRDEFMRELDKIHATGGLASVQDFVEAELVPGRVVIYGKAGSADATRTYRLIDREMRRCDQGGATLLDKPPVLARAAAMLRIDGKGRIESWQRLEARQPYTITVWWSDAGK